ncbi:MAG TPA: gluconate 2-dehydrogenase subunit 3 family protein [Aliiroseovarius sp.]|nr:gluconate 2-dehydrogenase subunit 3 family protein [Aliiroseovarius sp.]
MDRRRFLVSMSAGITASSALFSSLQSVQAAVTAAPPTIAGLTPAQWDLVALIQEHLLPTEADSPGAQTIHARRYLQSVLNEPRHDPGDRRFLLQGLTDLDALAVKRYRHRFFTLDHGQRETLLREYERSRDGHRWLRMLLDYLMEALLTDPVYGGNPQGVGWKWLRHTPGFPRPPAPQGPLFA